MDIESQILVFILKLDTISLIGIAELDEIMLQLLNIKTLAKLLLTSKINYDENIQLINQYEQIKNYKNIYKNAIKNQLNIIAKFLKINNYKTEHDFENACRYNNLDYVKWLYMNYPDDINVRSLYQLNYRLCKDTAQNDTIKYFIANIIRYSETHTHIYNLFKKCLKYGNFEIAIFLYNIKSTQNILKNTIDKMKYNEKYNNHISNILLFIKSYFKNNIATNYYVSIFLKCCYFDNLTLIKKMYDKNKYIKKNLNKILLQIQYVTNMRSINWLKTKNKNIKISHINTLPPPKENVDNFLNELGYI